MDQSFIFAVWLLYVWGFYSKCVNLACIIKKFMDLIHDPCNTIVRKMVY